MNDLNMSDLKENLSRSSQSAVSECSRIFSSPCVMEGGPQSNQIEKKSSGKIQEAKKGRWGRKEKGMLGKRVEQIKRK